MSNVMQSNLNYIRSVLHARFAATLFLRASCPGLFVLSRAALILYLEPSLLLHFDIVPFGTILSSCPCHDRGSSVYLFFFFFLQTLLHVSFLRERRNR